MRLILVERHKSHIDNTKALRQAHTIGCIRFNYWYSVHTMFYIKHRLKELSFSTTTHIFLFIVIVQCLLVNLSRWKKVLIGVLTSFDSSC